MHLPRTSPHAYTECSGIWNPIHTERTVARRKGLPDIIVHGTCTSAVTAMHLLRFAGSGPERLKRFACRFEAMVIPGTDVTLEMARTAGAVSGKRWTDCAGEIMSYRAHVRAEDLPSRVSRKERSVFRGSRHQTSDPPSDYRAHLAVVARRR